MVSFYAGLRTKEIAALKLGDVFDAEGRVREQFTLEIDQTKGGQRRSVFINKRLAKALDDYGLEKNLSNLERPLFESQKGGYFSANTMCQLFFRHLQSLWLQRCLKPFRSQDLHHTVSEQESKYTSPCSSRRAFAYLHHTALY